MDEDSHHSILTVSPRSVNISTSIRFIQLPPSSSFDPDGQSAFRWDQHEDPFYSISSLLSSISPPLLLLLLLLVVIVVVFLVLVLQGRDWHEFEGLAHGTLVGDLLVLPITAFSPGVGHMGAGPVGHPEARVQHLFGGSWRTQGFATHGSGNNNKNNNNNNLGP
ncbi:hypothetical protein Vafri_19944 [Volvox africanus]|nr:hypothetical protein Vafri_19944 [Volvox africanus]